MGIQEAEICVQLDVTELKPVPGNRFRVSRVAHRLFYSEEVEANDESWESLCHELSVDKTCTFYDLDDLDVVGEEYEEPHPRRVRNEQTARAEEREDSVEWGAPPC